MPSILFICMGNICRSPAAHGVMQHLCCEHKLNWKLDSCGTDAYHNGSRPDSRMQRVLQQHGIQFQHASQLFGVGMAYEFDLLLAMDMRNYEDIAEQLSYEPNDSGLLAKLQLFRHYDPQAGPQTAHGTEVPDPYYNGEQSFQEVYQMIWRTCNQLIEEFAGAS